MRFKAINQVSRKSTHLPKKKTMQNCACGKQKLTCVHKLNNAGDGFEVIKQHLVFTLILYVMCSTFYLFN